ncbi:MAG: acyl carrier protein [Butyrivibrio sp.]|jgi:acyl carrier protein|nr:acyl carrier protein [Butyrivibrio sp.]MCR4832462.1 acyl carrier protein [Butyrivibrio sp.]
MKEEMKFKSIVAQYCQVTPENMSGELRFREDLGFSSLDFMSMLGELEDEFDIELEEDKIINIHTIKEAMDMIKSLEVAV